MSDKFTCPRRQADGMDRSDSPFAWAGSGKDKWNETGGLVGQKGACSYCGSMHPEDFMDAVRDGAEIGPTDKSYKIYVRAAATDPDKLWVGSMSASPSPGTTHYSELTDKEREAVDEQVKLYPDPKEEGYYKFYTKTTQEGKFYTHHLSPEHSNEFRELYEDGSMNVGYPGHFYARLYLPGLKPKE